VGWHQRATIAFLVRPPVVTIVRIYHGGQDARLDELE